MLDLLRVTSAICCGVRGVGGVVDVCTYRHFGNLNVLESS